MAVLPQECPKCRRSLADEGVPEKYAAHKEQFSLVEVGKAIEPKTGKTIDVFRCPFCLHVWRQTGPVAERRFVGMNRSQRRAAAKAARR
jgi:Zn-finger nucleic acid-binding protein